MTTADERLLRERFAAFAGPTDGDWTDVRRRARRRTGTVVVAAAALILALAAAGLAIGAQVVGFFDAHGKHVPLSSFSERDRELLVQSMCRRLAISSAPGRAPAVTCRDGSPTVEEIANDGREIHWRVHYPWGVTCLASGPAVGKPNAALGDSRITMMGCNVGSPSRKLVPTPERPITVDASLGVSVTDTHLRLLRVEGLAGHGVTKVGLVPDHGRPLLTSVRNRAYSFGAIPERRWIAVAAYAADGSELYRERLQGIGRAVPRAIVHPAAGHVWKPKAPARPEGPPLQRARFATGVLDVFRNGVVELRFDSPASAAYRRLGRSARHSSGVVGMGCGTVAFGRGRWRQLGGGSNAAVGLRMAFRMDNVHGGMPSPPFDYCEVSGTYGRYWNDEEGPREIVEAPLTPIGRRYLDERATARDLAYFIRTKKLHGIRLAMHRGEPAPSAAELAQIFGPRLVPLASPKSTAPQGKIGVWSDGSVIVASELTPGGRRLYVTLRGALVGANNLGDLAFVF